MNLLRVKSTLAEMLSIERSLPIYVVRDLTWVSFVLDGLTGNTVTARHHTEGRLQLIF